MLDQLIFRNYPEFSEEGYQALVKQWQELRDTHEIHEFYLNEVFPHSCYRMRLQTERAPVELLFVPVGTQHYAPIMACLGVPARQIVLLHSERTLAEAEAVVGAFAHDPERRFQSVQIDEVKPADLVQKVQSSFDVLGQPAEVVCDITGGTKVMTATLAGLAAVNGWEQVYVHSEYNQRYGSHSERILQIASVFEQMGGWAVGMARRLAAIGQFGEASKLINQAMKDSLASAGLAREQHRFRLAHAYRTGQLATVKRGAPGLARKLGRVLSDEALVTLRDGPEQGYWYWVARTLLEEGQPLAACGALIGLGEACQPEQVKARLKTLAGEYSQRWRLNDWKAVDALLGSGYRREVSRDESH